jgi:hypothetical protein
MALVHPSLVQVLGVEFISLRNETYYYLFGTQSFDLEESFVREQKP